MSLYNEEATLPRWLSEGLLDVVDAYAISVDDKTTDSTRYILREHGVAFEEYRFENFSQMTNFNIERLGTDYVLTAAPDEWFEIREDLHALVEAPDAPDLFLFPRKHWADLERTQFIPSLHGDDWQPRLHRQHVRFGNAVHEWPVGHRNQRESGAIIIHHYAPHYCALYPVRAATKDALYARLQC